MDAVGLRLERARDRIAHGYAEPLDVATLAREAGLSRAHFLRTFKRRTGLTPHQALTRARILAAKDLLEATDLSVTEICFEVGFESVGSFSALFRRHTGRPPSHHRRKVWAVSPLQEAAFVPWAPGCFLLRFAGRALSEKRAPTNAGSVSRG